jgi:hypothetical protein
VNDRWGAGSAAVNGLFYIVGGFAGFRNAVGTMEAYSPITNTWTYQPTAPFGSFDPATAVMDNALFFLGGLSSSFAYILHAARYDTLKTSWTSLPDLPPACGMITAAAASGVLYVVCASPSPPVLLWYDSVAIAWVNVGAVYAGYVAGVDHYLLDYNGVLHTLTNAGSLFRLDPTTMQWGNSSVANTAMLPVATFHDIGFLGVIVDDSLLLVGLNTGTRAVVLNLKTNQTSQLLAATHQWRNSANGVLMQSRLYAAGQDHVTIQASITMPASGCSQVVP